MDLWMNIERLKDFDCMQMNERYIWELNINKIINQLTEI